MKTFAILAATALLIAGCDGSGTAGNGATATPAAGSTTPAVATPGGKDWTTTVVATPEGGFRMGNPDAPVKLIEFASMTCPVCQKFSAESVPALYENYVKTGQVSFEFRNFVFNQPDVVMSLLARCGGPGPFFKITEQMFADQGAILGRYQADPAALQAAEALPGAQTFVRVSEIMGIDKFVGMRGIPAAKARACLTDEAGTNKLVEMQQAGLRDFKVPGTPAFVINGKLAEDAITWAQLEPRIKTALAN